MESRVPCLLDAVRQGIPYVLLASALKSFFEAFLLSFQYIFLAEQPPCDLFKKNNK
jgi:hypothetical protein